MWQPAGTSNKALRMPLFFGCWWWISFCWTSKPGFRSNGFVMILLFMLTTCILDGKFVPFHMNFNIPRIFFMPLAFKLTCRRVLLWCVFVGHEAPGFMRKWVYRQKDGPFLQLSERHWRLPLVSKTTYLGMIVNYKAWDFDTTVRRIIAAQWYFRTLRSWFTSDIRPLITRFRLYRQCVLATVSYGVHEMGITRRGFFVRDQHD